MSRLPHRHGPPSLGALVGAPPTTPSHPRRHLAVVALVVAVLGTTLPARAAAPLEGPTQRHSGDRAPLPRGAVVTGPVDPASPLTLTLVLAPRVPLPSRWSGRPLAPAEVGTRFGADAATLAATTRWASDHGLRLLGIDANRFVVHLGGSAGQVEAALGTRLVTADLPVGRRARLALDDPALPTDLVGRVTAIVGLDDVARFHPHVRPLAPLGQPPRPAATSLGPCAQGTPQGTPYQPDQLASAYDVGGFFAAGMQGEGQTVALYELTDYADADVATYASCYARDPTVVHRIPVDGGTTVGQDSIEADLDIDVLLGMEPKVASILVYEAPNSIQGALDDLAAIVGDNRASVVGMTFGQCEQALPPAVVAAEAQLFAQAAFQGQTVVAASGDAGSSDCIDPTTGQPLRFPAVDDPAAQPQVVAVGGTTLNPGLPAQGGYVSESAWNSRAGATGGGQSAFWRQPTYQARVDLGPGGDPFVEPYPPPCAAGNAQATCREVPDVAADADPRTGYWVRCTTPSPCPATTCPNGWCVVGGTSLAAPLWAVVLSLVDESRARQGLSPLGDPHEMLYRLGTMQGAPFHDVTPGAGVSSNDITGIGVYPVTVGYDMTTGLGTPDAYRLSLVTPSSGYWLVAADGGVFTFGPAAAFYGSTGGQRLVAPVVGMAATPDDRGYWLVAQDGGVFTFGNAPFFGSTGGQRLDAPVVGMAPTPSGLGYWLVAKDGGVFTFGPTAAFFGSTGGQRLDAPVVGMAPTPDGGGYWLVAKDGGVFTFGNAAFFGSTGGQRLNAPVVGMAPTPSGRGYWLVAQDGGVFTFGDARFFGSTGGQRLNAPVVGMAPTPDGRGYWLAASDGGIFTFGDAAFFGSTGGQRLDAPVVGMAAVR